MTPDTTTVAPRTEEVECFVTWLRHASAGRLRRGVPCHVARAPGRLDVIGSISDYTGAVSICAPLGGAVLAAVQTRDDGKIVVVHLDGDGSAEECGTCDLQDLLAGEAFDSSAPGGVSLSSPDAPWAASVWGVVRALRRNGRTADGSGGMTCFVHCALPAGADAGVAAAASAATVLAASRALGTKWAAHECACICREALEWAYGVPAGLSAPLTSLLGETNRCLQLRCVPFETLGTLALPDGVALIGIDSGARHPNIAQKVVSARTAALMGRRLIQQIAAATGFPSKQWCGHLARFTVAEYVERLRDRLPTRLKGSIFLDRYGEVGEGLVRIDPQAVYKVRSRTEHHIYENARVRKFAERVAHAARTGDEEALHEAGRLMYASHWSYGQRCGLGSVGTDRLVTLLRRHGTHAGIYGAKISGDGGGGTVVVLLRDTDKAHGAVQSALKEYHARSEHRATMLTGSSPGAIVAGVIEFG